MTWFGEAMAGFKALDQLRKWYVSWRHPSVATRFVRLCESHGVHRNQIPRFFGHGLTLKDVQDDASLLAKIDEPLLDAVCERFAVRREWLDGVESQIYPCHDFYKHPEWFSDFIQNMQANNPEGEITGVLIAPSERDWEADALFVLRETAGSVGEKPIYRYHLCNNWGFSYWKARAYLTACVAIAWKHRVYVDGIRMPWKKIERLAEGETLLGWKGEGIRKLGRKTWDPEDMALQPNAFLNGIDPERDNYGIKSGLALWLDLEQQGFMDAGIKVGARQLFQQELAKYSAVTSAELASVARTAEPCQDESEEVAHEPDRSPKSASSPEPVAGKPRRRGKPARGVSAPAAEPDAALHGLRAGTGKPGAPETGPGTASTTPLDATRQLKTSVGALTYSEVAERMALRIIECFEEILDSPPEAVHITPERITDIHRRIAGELFPDWAGRFRITDVQVGTHLPPPGHDVPVHVQNYCLDLEERLRHLGNVESIAELLAWADWRFQWIHPFMDFNGRVGRILLTALLYKLRLPPIDPAPVDEAQRAAYLAALRAADRGDMQTLTHVWMERLSRYEK